MHRDRDEQRIARWHEQSRARASHRAYLSGALVMVRVLLLDDVDDAVTADHVEPLALRVVEEIVGVARDAKICSPRAGSRIEYKKRGGLARYYEKSMIGFIERHRKVRPLLPDLPGTHHPLLRPIDDG